MDGFDGYYPSTSHSQSQYSDARDGEEGESVGILSSTSTLIQRRIKSSFEKGREMFEQGAGSASIREWIESGSGWWSDLGLQKHNVVIGAVLVILVVLTLLVSTV